MTPPFANLPLADQLDAWLGPDTHTALATPTSGDVILRSATLGNQSMIVVAFDWTRSHGSIGPAEAAQLGEALAAAVERRVPLVFLMNTSGMRVTAGMATVAALRSLLRAVLDAKLAGQRMFAVITRNAYGGASMLATLCDRRVMNADAVLGMSGPKLIERIAGRDALTASDPVAVRALLGGAARAHVTDTTDLCADSADAYRGALASWLREAGHASAQRPHDWLRALRSRLGNRARATPALADHNTIDATTSRVIEHVLGRGAEVLQSDDLIVARSTRPDAPLVLGLVGGGAASAPAVLALTEQILRIADDRGSQRIVLLADVGNHSAEPSDERLVLSEYLAHLALSIRFAHSRGHEVRLVVTGVAGGGIFAALAAGATRVEMLPEAVLQVLSPAALAAIDKQAEPDSETLAAALAAGSVDTAFLEAAPA